MLCMTLKRREQVSWSLTVQSRLGGLDFELISDAVAEVKTKSHSNDNSNSNSNNALSSSRPDTTANSGTPPTQNESKCRLVVLMWLLDPPLTRCRVTSWAVSSLTSAASLLPFFVVDQIVEVCLCHTGCLWVNVTHPVRVVGVTRSYSWAAYGGSSVAVRIHYQNQHGSTKFKRRSIASILLIVQVCSQTPKSMSELVSNSIGASIRVTVKRNPEGIVRMSLVPNRWAGRGLLG